jgi:hypothetical protein
VARGLCKNHYQQMRYAERKAASGQTVRRRRTSGTPTAGLEAAKPSDPASAPKRLRRGQGHELGAPPSGIEN